ncbi:MAG: 5-formyltetrahydrofolate cyclo-ligase [Mobilitalea sp.]
MTKDQIRTEHKKRRNILTFEEQKIYNRAIRERLFQIPRYRSSDFLFTFVSFQSEVDTIEIIRQAFLDHKKVYVPRVEDHGMEFYEIHSLEGMTTSNFGVLEPPKKDEYRYIGTKEPKLMLLPGLAFDYSGNRIGFGAGYYDQYLTAHKKEHFYNIALAYDFQVLESIPAEQFDVKADAILTQTQLFEI